MKNRNTTPTLAGALRDVCLIVLLMAIFIFAFMPLVFDGIEKEDAWRKDRLCRIYEVCTPEQGP